MANSTLNKKLKSYSALAGTMVAAANTAGAQVVYTDVTPDAVVDTSVTYPIDLDNDSNIDFFLGVQHGTYLYGGTFPIQYDIALIAPNVANAIDTTGGPVAHVTNDAINNSLLWCDDAGASYQLLGLNLPMLGYSTGNFIGQNDKYVGLRFKIAGADHYGWVRVDVAADATTITVKDYAYDATAGNSILCGATATGIAESATLANTVSVVTANNTILVNMNNAAIEGFVTVTNTLGQEIAKVKITNSTIEIPMNNASAGVYMVNVMQNSAKFSKKVIVK